MAIAVGDSAERTFPVTDEVLDHFGAATGDLNPMHFDDAFAATTMFGGRIAHGMLTAGFISTMIGMELPGPGAIYLGQTLQFRAPVRPGDEVRVRVEVTEYDPERRRGTLDTRAWVGEKLVVAGEARVIAPE
jgi:3-hydroxybutyryl-CoA dehydratase